MDILEVILMISIIVILIITRNPVKNTKNLEKTQKNIVEKPKKAELTEEQKKKQEKLREHFENLMGFDYEKALKSKGE